MIRPHQPRPLLLQVANGGLGGGGFGGQGGGGAVPGQGGVTAGGFSGQGPGRGVDFRPLIHLITTTVAPDTWSDAGGSGTIAPYAPGLAIVVRQTPAVHDQIADVLRQLRGSPDGGRQ